MKREEAIEVISSWYEDSSKNLCALDMAITALRQPGWVRTAERLPEGGEMELVQGAYRHREWGFMLHEIIAIGWLKSHPEMYPYWMPLPPLPENAGLEGTKING